MKTIEEISGNVNEIDYDWWNYTNQQLLYKLGIRVYDLLYR